MSSQRITQLLPLFLLIMAMHALPSKADSKDCVKAVKVTGVGGTTCSNLKLTVDMSACGGPASLTPNIVNCSGGDFTAEVKNGADVYTFSGKGSSWGGQTVWSTDKVSVSFKTGKAVAEVTAPAKPKRKPAQSDAKPEPVVPAVAEPTVKAPTSTVIIAPAAPAAPAATTSASPTSPAKTETATAPATTPAVTPAAPAVVPTPLADLKALFTVYGDLRHRYEAVQNQSPTAGKDGRYDQMRLRARLGVKAQPTEDVTLDFRLATAAGGTATNQTYGEGTKGMRNYDFKLDRASAKWAPLPYAYLLVGRTANPFGAAGGNDLVFDADLNFDGTSLSFDHKTETFGIYLRGGQYILEESKDAVTNTDVKLNAIQLGASLTAVKNFTAILTGSMYHYANFKGHSALIQTNGVDEFSGNSNTGTAYVNDYKMNSVGLELGYKWFVPVSIFFEDVNNTEAKDKNKASIYGIKFNKLKNKGDWAASIDHRRIEKDAIVGILTDGDSFGGGTNGESTRYSLGYAISNAFQINLTQFIGKKNIADGETSVQRNKTQVDLNFSF